MESVAGEYHRKPSNACKTILFKSLTRLMRLTDSFYIEVDE